MKVDRVVFGSTRVLTDRPIMRIIGDKGESRNLRKYGIVWRYDGVENPVEARVGPDLIWVIRVRLLGWSGAGSVGCAR